MSLYQIIIDQLSQSGIHYPKKELQKLDIIEYMVLEFAGALPSLQNKPLKCIFRPGHTSNIMFQDEKKHSSLEFGLKNIVFDMDGPSISKEEQLQFFRIIHSIENKFPESTFDSEHQCYNYFGTLYAVILLDEDIEQAIRCSSLFVAAGDLTGFDIESLLILRKKLNLYHIADTNLSILVNQIIDKINVYISEHFDPSLIQQTLPKVEKKFAVLLAIQNKEHVFNHALNKLNIKLGELIRKGTKTYEFNHPNGQVTSIENKTFDPNYSSVVPFARSLSTTLGKARTHFFTNPMSQKSFEAFKQTCKDAIENSKADFAKYLSWAEWDNDLNPLFKPIINCIKEIGDFLDRNTIFPMLKKIYPEHCYKGLFFNPKTETLRTLESFEQKLCSDKGFFDELSEDIHSLGMTV